MNRRTLPVSMRKGGGRRDLPTSCGAPCHATDEKGESAREGKRMACTAAPRERKYLLQYGGNLHMYMYDIPQINLAWHICAHGNMW